MRYIIYMILIAAFILGFVFEFLQAIGITAVWLWIISIVAYSNYDLLIVDAEAFNKATTSNKDTNNITPWHGWQYMWSKLHHKTWIILSGICMAIYIFLSL